MLSQKCGTQGLLRSFLRMYLVNLRHTHGLLDSQESVEFFHVLILQSLSLPRLSPQTFHFVYCLIQLCALSQEVRTNAFAFDGFQ